MAATTRFATNSGKKRKWVWKDLWTRQGKGCAHRGRTDFRQRAPAAASWREGGGGRLGEGSGAARVTTWDNAGAWGLFPHPVSICYLLGSTNIMVYHGGIESASRPLIDFCDS
jgi:hypothetical protein